MLEVIASEIHNKTHARVQHHKWDGDKTTHFEFTSNIGWVGQSGRADKSWDKMLLILGGRRRRIVSYCYGQLAGCHCRSPFNHVGHECCRSVVRAYKVKHLNCLVVSLFWICLKCYFVDVSDAMKMDRTMTMCGGAFLLFGACLLWKIIGMKKMLFFSIWRMTGII